MLPFAKAFKRLNLLLQLTFWASILSISWLVAQCWCEVIYQGDEGALAFCSTGVLISVRLAILHMTFQVDFTFEEVFKILNRSKLKRETSSVFTTSVRTDTVHSFLSNILALFSFFVISMATIPEAAITTVMIIFSF
jgi:hypothetical protein